MSQAPSPSASDPDDSVESSSNKPDQNSPQLPTAEILEERRKHRNSMARVRAGNFKERVAAIQSKPEDERTEEENDLLQKYEEQRTKKNKRQRERDFERKMELQRIQAKHESLRTDEERQFVQTYREKKRRKNMGDTQRRQRKSGRTPVAGDVLPVEKIASETQPIPHRSTPPKKRHKSLQFQNMYERVEQQPPTMPTQLPSVVQYQSAFTPPTVGINTPAQSSQGFYPRVPETSLHANENLANSVSLLGSTQQTLYHPTPLNIPSQSLSAATVNASSQVAGFKHIQAMNTGMVPQGITNMLAFASSAEATNQRAPPLPHSHQLQNPSATIYPIDNSRMQETNGTPNHAPQSLLERIQQSPTVQEQLYVAPAVYPAASMHIPMSNDSPVHYGRVSHSPNHSQPFPGGYEYGWPFAIQHQAGRTSIHDEIARDKRQLVQFTSRPQLSIEDRIKRDELAKEKKSAMARQQRYEIALIESKPESERTEEEQQQLERYNDLRLRRNSRSRERASEKKLEMERILAIPESQRSNEENEWLKRKLAAKKRKNNADRQRRLVKAKEEEEAREARIAEQQRLEVEEQEKEWARADSPVLPLEDYNDDDDDYCFLPGNHPE